MVWCDVWRDLRKVTFSKFALQLPSHAPADSADTASPLPEALTALGRMVQLLPPGYDVGRIPPEVLQYARLS